MPTSQRFSAEMRCSFWAGTSDPRRARRHLMKERADAAHVRPLYPRACAQARSAGRRTPILTSGYGCRMMGFMLSILISKWALFVKVTELGSLTHAASVLNMPQAVISRQIGVLERECGARLFRRTGRGVVLTDFGQQIFPRVKALIAQADQLSDDIRSSNGQPLGDVRLGI